MFVQFRLDRLETPALDLLVTALGSGWLYDALAEEQLRRTRGEPSPDFLLLPDIDGAEARAAYLELGRSLLAVEEYQLGTDVVTAAMFDEAAHLISAVMLAIKRDATQPGASRLN